MAKIKSAEDVFRAVDRLADSQDMQAYRRIMRENWSLHTMSLPSELPEYVVRRTDVQIDMPSELVMQTSQNLLSAVDAFPHFETVVPYNSSGNPTQAEKTRADKLERHVTLAWRRMDTESGATSMARWHQVNSGYGVIREVTLPPPRGEDRKRPFFHMALDVPDPTTCFFPLKNGRSFRPAQFGMKQRVLVKWVQDEYTNFDGNGMRPICSKGGWTLAALDDGRAVEASDVYTGWRSDGRDAGAPLECEWYYYDDGECIYHAVKGLDKGRNRTGQYASKEQNGAIVYEADNPIGRVMAVVVPGQATPLREPGKQCLAVLEALLACCKKVNFLTSFVATISMTNPTDMVINASPEQLGAMKNLGLVQPASQIEMQSGGPYLIHVGGNATEWKWAPTEAPIEVLGMLREDALRLANDWQGIIDKELLTGSTATAWSLTTETQEQRKTSMLKHLDQARSMILRDYLDSAATYNDVAPMTVYSTGEVRRLRGGSIGMGDAAPLSKSDLDDFDYDVFSATRQETEGQLGMRLQQGFLEEDRGITSHDQVMAIKYPDTTAQRKELARALGRNLMAPVVMATADLKFRAEMITEAGLRLPENFAADIMAQMLAGAGGGMQGQAPQQAQAPQTFQAATNGAQGAEMVPA